MGGSGAAITVEHSFCKFMSNVQGCPRVGVTCAAISVTVGRLKVIGGR